MLSHVGLPMAFQVVLVLEETTWEFVQVPKLSSCAGRQLRLSAAFCQQPGAVGTRRV